MGVENGPLNQTINGFDIRGFPAPLAGTEPLVSQFAAVKAADAKSETENPDPAVVITRFVTGSHGNPINPSANRDVTVEMISQFINFFATNGNIDQSIVTNKSVVVE